MRNVTIKIPVADWIPDSVLETFAYMVSDHKGIRDSIEETLHEALDTVDLLGKPAPDMIAVDDEVSHIIGR